MSILDKLTPRPPQAEVGAPSVSLSIEGQRVANALIEALRQKGIKVNPDDLIPQAPPTPDALPPKESLTQAEEALFNRSKTFADAALRSQGISLRPEEVKWLGALVADFVLSEQSLASAVQVVLVDQAPALPPAQDPAGTGA